MAERTPLNLQGLSLPITVIVIVLMIIVPLPVFLLDVLMATNLLLTILVLIVALTANKVTDFSQFPTVLLLLMILSLGLNVSSTRLILTLGTRFNGRMVNAFATFVTGSSGNQGLIIGFVIFIIITAMQVFVITKGAKRTAEVNARYMLDAMPIKQATLESEFNQGVLNEEDLRQRKMELQLEIDLARAMDGASNFVANTAKLGIFVTVINLVAGIILGMVLRSEPFNVAIQTYAKFTIGDGLLAQIPSLFTSVATGLLVSRSASQQSLETDIFSQFSQSATAFYVGGGTMVVLGILPGFPWYIMVPLGASLLFVGSRLIALKKKKTAADSSDAKKQKQTAGGSPSDVPPVVPLDPLSLEIGFALIPLVDQAKGAELLERVTRIRREAAVDMGLVVPRVRIIDNMRLDPQEYCVKIKGVEVGRSKIRMNWYLCMNTGAVTEEVPGEKTIEPTFGLPAIWITEDNRERAERAGYAVVDPPTIIATHLNQIIKSHAAEILGRQDVQLILDAVKKDYPAVVDGVLSIGGDSFTLGEIQKVMQGLLREQVSIRNTVAILETLADFAKITHHTGVLIEKVRQRLGRQICLQYVDENQMLHVVTIAQDFQKKLLDSRVELVDGWGAALDPPTHRAWISAVSSTIAAMQDAGFVPAMLCPEEVRALVRGTTEREMPNLVILSIPEIPSDIKIESVGEIKVG
jgi:flagellar biosynthesis protein FlhA